MGRRRSIISQNRTADKYERWCGVNGCGAFPVSYGSLSGFFCALVISRRGSSKSIANDLAAVRRRAREIESVWLTAGQDQKLKDLVAAMRFNDNVLTDRKSPLQLKHLRAAVKEWDLSSRFKLQEAAILFMGHDCLFRTAELLGGLRAGDVTWKHGNDEYSVWLARSKCNRSGDGEWITCKDYGGVNSVSLLKDYMSAAGLMESPGALLFPSRRGQHWNGSLTISPSWLRRSIKNVARALQLDPRKYSGHSLRAGGATDLFVARVPYFAIKKMGRWKSDSAMLYYRCEEDVCKAVTEAFKMLGD